MNTIKNESKNDDHNSLIDLLAEQMQFPKHLHNASIAFSEVTIITHRSSSGTPQTHSTELHCIRVVWLPGVTELRSVYYSSILHWLHDARSMADMRAALVQ